MASTDDNNRKIQKVFIQRDYSEGTAVQFVKKCPLELEGKISRKVVEETVTKINKV